MNNAIKNLKNNSLLRYQSISGKTNNENKITAIKKGKNISFKRSFLELINDLKEVLSKRGFVNKEDKKLEEILSQLQILIQIQLEKDSPYFNERKSNDKGNFYIIEGKTIVIVVSLLIILEKNILYPFGSDVIRGLPDNYYVEMMITDKDGIIGIAEGNLFSNVKRISHIEFSKFWRINSDNERKICQIEDFKPPIIFTTKIEFK